MADNEELDIVELESEDGGSLQLLVERYFFFNGEEYVLLTEDLSGNNDPEAAEYIMKVEPVEGDEDMEDFVPIDDEALEEKLMKAVRAVNAMDDEDEDEE